MPRDIFEPFAVAVDEEKTSLVKEGHKTRPSWKWILREEIEPLCAKYGLVITYEDETDKSCAIFFDDVQQQE